MLDLDPFYLSGSLAGPLLFWVRELKGGRVRGRRTKGLSLS